MSNASTDVTSKAKLDTYNKIVILNEKSNDLDTTLSTKTKNITKNTDSHDEYGISNRLRMAIDKKYEIIELIGNGSYGYVT